MYRGVVLLYSPRDNLPSVLAVGYNSIQRPVIVVSISIYYFYTTFLECFLDLPSLPCDTFWNLGKHVEVYDTELFGILQATTHAREWVERRQKLYFHRVLPYIFMLPV